MQCDKKLNVLGNLESLQRLILQRLIFKKESELNAEENEFFKLCSFVLNSLEDLAQDLRYEENYINASEKEDKFECGLCNTICGDEKHFREHISYGCTIWHPVPVKKENKIDSVKKDEIIEKINNNVKRWWNSKIHLAKKNEEAMKNLCHTCCIVFSSKEELARHNQNKVKEESKMKHPCGKVFDVVKEFKLNTDDSTAIVEFFEISHNYIIVKNKHKGFSTHHLSCGCDVRDSEHRGSYINLVNVPEVREVDLGKVFLKKMDHGDISIRYKDDRYNWFLFKILKNGTIVRADAIPLDLGFQLDEQGRIKLDE
jgi:hypothetical protein